ncbi:hypothetical protein [Luteolibacter sp. Populi]|uniref:hypothetical protein n=1 Tax=Luteolibacter sp. Populi TaxID=3230487 RepID=UPI0034669927
MKRSAFLCSLAALAIAPLATAEVLSVAHPEVSFPADKTVVWTPLFQAAWDRLNTEIGGAPVKVEPPNDLMTKLDTFQWRAEEVMPVDRWKVWSGLASAGFVKTTNQEAAAMTGEAAGPFSGFDEAAEVPGRVMVLALLDRDLNYTKGLYRGSTAPLEFQGKDGKASPVKFFGVRAALSGEFGDVVRILAREGNSHALQIAAAGEESLVLYLPAGAETFAEAGRKVVNWREGGLKGESGSESDPRLHKNDDLRIPYLNLAVRTDFKPLLAGDRSYTDNPTTWSIVRAEQKVDFQMTEKGAKVQATTELGADPLGAPPKAPPVVPRKFYFDRPFFVFMWRDGAAWPYFGAWVGDTAAMEAWK